MSKRRVLITGGTGLLALNWACAVRQYWDVVLGTHLHSVRLKGASSYRLDLDCSARLAQQFDAIAPDLVVHTAGLTNVDSCEEDAKLARHVNAELARNVAICSARRGVRLIHISTDHLFAGTHSYYREDDPLEPINTYARTKALAEELVLETYSDALIVRTNFFGWGHATRKSSSDWILEALRADKPVRMFNDVFVTPILADRLALAVHQLVSSGVSGVFNVVGDERVSKYQFACGLAQHFDLPLSLIHSDTVANAKLLAKRPRDMSLNNSKAKSALGGSLGGLDEYFRSLRTQEHDGRHRELLGAHTSVPLDF